MTKIASISLDIRKNNTVDNEPIVLRQGDSDVIIEASISNNGYPNLEIGFATFVAKKPDGTIISNDPASVNGNTISYPISKHLTESVGKIQDAYFMINNQITTCGFDISIIPSAQLDDTSVNYIPGLEDINKFLESTEADWLGRIQQMKAQIDGLNVPDEFKLLMDKALSDAKAQYQPTIDAAEENVESIVADLAAKKLDLQNNSDELNQTITTIKAQVASINSFLDNIQKQIIDANTSFTAGQQAQISQSIADSQKKLADSIASMQSQVSQSIAELKTKIDALTVAKTGPKGDKGETGPTGPQGPKGDKGDTGSVDNDGLIKAPAFVELQTQVDNSAVGTNLLLKTYEPNIMIGNNTINQFRQMYALSKRIEAGTTITISFDAVSTASTNFLILNNAKDGGDWFAYITDTVDTTKKHYVATVNTTSFADLGINIRFDNVPSTTTITVSNMKLELGSYATDYSLNPLDITNALGKVDIGKTITATDDTGKTVKLKITGIS